MVFLRSILCASLLHAPLSYAHMAMTDPEPWDSPRATNAAVRDYDIKSPLQGDGSNFPCQGVQEAASAPVSANYTAGETYNMMLEGSANHGGGSCQLALSYDEGETFKVIKSVVGGCPARGEATYNFTIPKKAPSGKALFAWTWINHSGNREFYMNCAAVRIRGDDNASSGNSSSLCGLPNLYVAGISSINSCRSTEGVDIVYPNPGDDVEYNGDATASSP
ncbi:lytic polysaccharide monooxygenase, partial [Aplosporella prunicola CBS 121167]